MVRPLANRDPKINIGYFRTTDFVYRQLFFFFFITLNLTWKISYPSYIKGYSCCQFNLENKKNLSVRRTERKIFIKYGDTVTSRICCEDNQSSIEIMKTLIPTVLYIYYTNIVNYYLWKSL